MIEKKKTVQKIMKKKNRCKQFDNDTPKIAMSSSYMCEFAPR
jgi:hypothetical protein